MTLRKEHPFRAVFRSDQLGWEKYKNEGRGFGFVGAIHKGNIETVPRRIVNEIICGEIGRFLGLPVPPLGISFGGVPDGDATQPDYLFSSLDFNFERDALPPIEPQVCVEKMANVCAGILVFDILIANPDRRKENLWADNVGFPKRLMVFDHDQALLGGEHDGVERLEQLHDRLGLAFLVRPDSHYHCFLKLIPSARLIEPWINRVLALPDWFVETQCDMIRSFNRALLPSSDAKAIVRFFEHRRKFIDTIIHDNQSHFEAITDWVPPGSLY